ncbi:MAG TPA: apolipoprotein N-acyltransferase [Acidimicrobiales bacterium]|nr:apolipoprotein N-acyltransferase [Acidimicrobiales bacterium]
MRKSVTLLACLGTGVLIAAALPPWGWWPLAFPGVALLDRLIADRPRGARFRRGMAVGLGLYVPSLAWMTDMTLPGYLIAAVAYAALLGAAAVMVPAAAPGRWLALPGAIALTELLRWSWPFGGVPLSSLAVGQVAGPLAPVLRVGGALLLVEVAVVAGIALAALARRRWLAGAAALAVVLVALGAATVAPRGRQVDTLRVALVQGGGPQGTRAADTDEREVFERHLAASDAIEGPVDLVVWPEDVVDVGTLASSKENDELAALARQLDTTLVAGVVEDAGDEHFLNFSAAYGPDGDIVDRYDKVHRVPFGEYVPLRSLLEPFGGDDLTSRDAIVGEHPATLDTPAATLSVAISWEIFFGDRVREGVGDGAGVVLNPTNGSSFTGTLVQTQQIASSRMRAIESGRWLLQVAPTGFTAVIEPDGTVGQRSAVSEQAVLHATVGVREGTTLYTRWGLAPALVVAGGGLTLGWALARRARRDDPAPVGEDGQIDVRAGAATVAGDARTVEVGIGAGGGDLDGTGNDGGDGRDGGDAGTDGGGAGSAAPPGPARQGTA